MQGLLVIGINEDGPRSQSKVKPFVRSLKIEFPVLIDNNNEVMRQFQVQSLPTAILIAADGTIIARHVGYQSDAMENLENEIKALFKDDGDEELKDQGTRWSFLFLLIFPLASL